MALDVDKEDIIPVAAARGTRLDAGHADAVFGQRRQQAMQAAGLVADRHQQTGLVLAGRRDVLFADHQKTGGVVRLVLDVVRQNVQAVELGGGLTGNGRRGLLAARQTRRLGVAADRHALACGRCRSSQPRH